MLTELRIVDCMGYSSSVCWGFSVTKSLLGSYKKWTFGCPQNLFQLTQEAKVFWQKFFTSSVLTHGSIFPVVCHCQMCCMICWFWLLWLIKLDCKDTFIATWHSHNWSACNSYVMYVFVWITIRIVRCKCFISSSVAFVLMPS